MRTSSATDRTVPSKPRLHNGVTLKLTPLLILAIALLCGFSCDADRSESANVGADSANVRTFGEPKLAVKLAEAAINESSGVARSHEDSGSYFTHNDSGDSARFWKFDLKGTVIGPYAVQGASAVDWEDMASAKLGGKSYLYFADIGDNAERRTSIQIYRVEEPKGAPAAGGLKAEVFDLTYPDGPHNAETFLVNPLTGEFTIVTKTTNELSLVFALKNPKPGASRLTKAGVWKSGEPAEPARLTTGGDFSADGRYVVVRTYLAAYEFELPFSGEWWKTNPVKVKLAAELQGEAIAYSLDGLRLVTTSEFNPCPVSTVTITP